MTAIQTFNQPLERTRWFLDCDGVISTSKRSEDIAQLVIDWTDQLGGATISSVTYVDSGVTTSAKSNTTTTTTCDFTGIGETEIQLTLSSSRHLRRKIRAYDIEGPRRRDYA